MVKVKMIDKKKGERKRSGDMENQAGQYTTEYEILELLKLKLYQRLHGLAPVLGAVKFRIEEPKQPEHNGGVEQESADKACAGFRTDGRVFYLSPSQLRSDFLKDSDFLCRELLHMLSHCLLGHPFEAWRVEREKRKAWESDCDEKAWALTEELWGKSIPEKPPADDHSLWGKKPDEREKAFWQGQGEKLLRSGNPRGKRKAGTAKRHRTRQLVPAAGQRGDYRSILRGLSSYREDSRLNLDEFQYSWYTYGLEMYGNMPLIEPLEYSEERKIADLVIVIDTSGSCEKELVRVFLEETRGILEQDRLFFRSFCLHLLQCDNQIQRDDCIHSREEFEKYLEHLEIRGGGGTDFRPAFERIEELRQRGELRDLQGILYFTDGCGWYPKKEPDYQVWFVMLQGHFDSIDMPDWVHRLVLEEKRA